MQKQPYDQFVDSSTVVQEQSNVQYDITHIVDSSTVELEQPCDQFLDSSTVELEQSNAQYDITYIVEGSEHRNTL